MSAVARLVILTSGVPGALALATLSPILPKMEAALAHDATDNLLVKMVIGAGAVAMVLAAPLAGVLGDRTSRILVIGWSTILSAVIGALEFFIDDLRLMLLTRLLVGATGAAAMIVGIAAAGDIANVATRHRYMGLTVSIASIVSVGGIALAGVLGDIYWRLAFLLYLASLPLGLIAVWKTGDGAHARAGAGAASDAPPVPADPFRVPIGLMLLAVYTGISQYMPLTYIPYKFRDLGVSSSTTIGMALTVEVILVAITSSCFGLLRARVSAPAAFGIAFALLGFGGGGVAFSTGFVSAAASLFVIGLGVGCFSPNLATTASALADTSSRAKCVGLVKGANLSGSLVGVLVVEPIFRFAGVQGVFVAMAVMMLAAALVVAGIVAASSRRRQAGT
jgi:MFS family permease